MKLLRRSHFGWPASSAASANPTSGITVHYNGGPTGLSESAPHSRCVTYWKNTRNFHVNGNGWQDIGYSWGICPHGYVFEGRGLRRTQAAQPGGNSSHYSVTFMIGGSERPGTLHLAAWRDVRDYLFAQGVRRSLTCHSDFVATSCPGDVLRRMVRDGSLLSGAGNGSVDPGPGSGSGGGSVSKAPAWPLPAGYYFGPRSGPVQSVSGYFSHRSDLRRWQQRMKDRGWAISADGLYGAETARVARAFQLEKGLSADSLIGPQTWRAAWETPVT